MKNNKGFVLTETLVVTVFLITIFTFIYVSIVPLMGKYEDIINREKDIDIVYKLYHIRKLIADDRNRSNIAASPHNTITCSDFYNSTYCTKLMQYLELSSYKLVYVDNINNSLDHIKTISVEMYDYIKQYRLKQYHALILLDMNKHTIAHLIYSDN